MIIIMIPLTDWERLKHRACRLGGCRRLEPD